jgi:hypothetical protein
VIAGLHRGGCYPYSSYSPRLGSHARAVYRRASCRLPEPSFKRGSWDVDARYMGLKKLGRVVDRRGTGPMCRIKLAVGVASDEAVRWRSLGALFLAGGFLTEVAIPLPLLDRTRFWLR